MLTVLNAIKIPAQNKTDSIAENLKSTETPQK